jgi:regulator of replication initiation timing
MTQTTTDLLKEINESIQKLANRHASVCRDRDGLQIQNIRKQERIDFLEQQLVERNPYETVTVDSLINDRTEILAQVAELKSENAALKRDYANIQRARDMKIAQNITLAEEREQLKNRLEAVANARNRASGQVKDLQGLSRNQDATIARLLSEKEKLQADRSADLDLRFRNGFRHAIQVLQSDAVSYDPDDRSTCAAFIREGFKKAAKALQNELARITESPITEEKAEEGWSKLFIGCLCGADMFVEYLTPEYKEATQETELFKKDLQRVIEGHPITGNAPSRPRINIFVERTSDTPDGLLNVIVHLARLGWPIEVKWKAEKKRENDDGCRPFDPRYTVFRGVVTHVEDRPTCACHAADAPPKDHTFGCPVHILYFTSPLED